MHIFIGGHIRLHSDVARHQFIDPER